MGKGKIIPQSQEDWYMAATSYEEQAERWFLSDITKTLRFYIQALECYEKALEAPGKKPLGSYHILYNETRLLLQVHTEYVANSGYINILQYIKLSSLPGISNLIISLPDILGRFEAVERRFQENITWDFRFNMLTCYLSLLESADIYNLTIEDIVQLATKYVELTGILMSEVMRVLQLNGHKCDREESSSPPGPNHEVSLNKGDDRTTDDVDDSQGVEVADQIDHETMEEILNNGFKCVQVLVEACVTFRFDARQGGAPSNLFQLDRLECISQSFGHQLTEARSMVNPLGVFDLRQADISCMAIDALKLINHDVSVLEEFLYSVSPRTPDVLLAQVDLLQVVLECCDSADTSLQWSLCTLLNKILVEVRTQFTHLRSKVSPNPTSELSKITFHLCDIYVDSSDNELTRYWVRRNSNGNDDKTCQTLLKNAKTLLINAMRISEKSCGLQENNVDRLKRNYVFKQAKYRIDALESGSLPVDQMRDELQDLQDHPYYRHLAFYRE